MCDDCGAAEFADMLEDELQGHDFGKVTPFLEDVLAFARDNDHVTEDQRRGVQNCLDRK